MCSEGQGPVAGGTGRQGRRGVADERGPDEEDIGMRVAKGSPSRSETPGIVGEWHMLTSSYVLPQSAGGC